MLHSQSGRESSLDTFSLSGNQEKSDPARKKEEEEEEVSLIGRRGKVEV